MWSQYRLFEKDIQVSRLIYRAKECLTPEACLETHCRNEEEGIASEIRTSSKIGTISTGKAND